MQWIFLFTQLLSVLILISWLTGCVSISPKASMTHATDKGKLVVSSSGNYGVWVPRSFESSPLTKNTYYHVISHPGGSENSISLIVMQWIERDLLSRDAMLQIVKDEDYNKNIY